LTDRLPGQSGQIRLVGTVERQQGKASLDTGQVYLDRSAGTVQPWHWTGLSRQVIRDGRNMLGVTRQSELVSSQDSSV
jgi:hypothetical protein